MPRQIPHHGGATRAGPIENEHAHDLPLVWKPAHPLLRSPSWQAFAPNEYCGAARATKTSQTKPPQENFFSICFVLTEQLGRVLLTRNGCATILSLIQPTRPVRLSNAQNK
jgi:hypothetical protein